MNESLIQVMIKVFYAKYVNMQVPTIGDFQQVKNFKRQRQRQKQRHDRDNDKNRDRDRDRDRL